MAAPASRFGATRNPTSANTTGQNLPPSSSSEDNSTSANATGNNQTPTLSSTENSTSANATGNTHQTTIVPPNGEPMVLDSAPAAETAVPQALAAVNPRKKWIKMSDQNIYARDKDPAADLFGGIDLSRNLPTPEPETPKEPVWQSAKQRGKRRASADLGAGEPRSGTLLKELAIHEPEVDPFPRAKAEVPKREFLDVSAVTPELHAKMRKVPYQPYFTTDPERKFPRSIIHGSADDLEYAYRHRDVPKFTAFDPKKKLNSVVKIQLSEHDWLTVGSVMSYKQYITEQNKFPELHAKIESLLNPPEDMDTNDDGEDEIPADGTIDDDMVDRPTGELEEPPQREAKEVERKLVQDQNAEELAAALKEKDIITDMINPTDVKSWVTLCSARPAVNLQIVMARDSEGRPSRTVTCKIYATGIRVEDNDVGFDMARGKTVIKDENYIDSIHPGPIDRSTFPASSEHHVEDAYQDDRLLQFVVYPHVHVTNRELSELKSRPVFGGITKQELAMLFTKVRRDPDSLSPAAKLVAFLAHGDPKAKNNATADDRDDFAIHIFCESSPEAKITDFCAYARVLFYGAASLGNHWFSRIEAGQRLAVEEFPYDVITPPRWMVSKWRVWSKLDKQGKTVLTKQGKPMIEEVVPIEWQSYAEIDLHLYPDARTLAHELVGCEARESLKAKNDVDRLSGKDNTKFHATVIRHPDESNDKLQDCYLVFLTFKQSEQRLRIQPPIGTRCNFSLWHEGQVVTLASHVVKNVKPKEIKVGGKNTGASYDDCITLWSKPIKPLVTPLKEDKIYEVLLKYISDSTSANRAINSLLKVLNSSVEDPLGSWFKDLLFAMPAPGGEDMTSAKYRSNRMSISLRIKEDGTFNLFQAEYEPKAAGMNEDQKKFAELLLNEYASAFIKVSGKSSWCAVPAIRALWAAGFKILVCAVTNMAVFRVMEELVKDIERNPPAWDGYDLIQLARYKSALAKATEDQPANTQPSDRSMSTPLGTAPGASAAHDEEVDQKLLNLSYFERAALDNDDDYLPEFGFGRQKLRFLQNSLQGKNVDSARRYLALRTRLAATKNAKDRKEVRLQLNDAEGEWANRYLSECVRILFVTTNSCGSAALTAFRPDIGFVDEAGRASTGDLAIVVHAFPTLKKLCAFGDPTQTGPVSFSGSCNEFQRVSKDAPFSREIEQGIGDIVFL